MKKKATFLISIAFLTIISNPVLAADGKPIDGMTFEELRKGIEKVLKSGRQQNIRMNVPNLYRLGDLYAEKGEYLEADKLYKKALAYDAWNLEAQLKSAKILVAKVDMEKEKGLSCEDDEFAAINRVQFVYIYTEDMELRNEAKTLLLSLGAEVPSGPSAIVPDHTLTIEIVPMGDVDPLLLDEAMVKMQNVMGINYKISNHSILIEKFDRTESEYQVDRMYNSFVSSAPQGMIDLIEDEVGFTLSENISYDDKAVVILAIMDNMGAPPDVKSGLNAMLKEKQDEGHLEVKKLRDRLVDEVSWSPSANPVGYIGITSHRLFNKGAGFSSYNAVWGFAVMSYASFLESRINDGFPDRQRLVDRIAKCGVYCSLFIIGQKPCDNPLCASLEHQSLDALDSQTINLCEYCKKRIGDYIDAQVIKVEEEPKITREEAERRAAEYLMSLRYEVKLFDIMTMLHPKTNDFVPSPDEDVNRYLLMLLGVDRDVFKIEPRSVPKVYVKLSRMCT